MILRKKISREQKKFGYSAKPSNLNGIFYSEIHKKKKIMSFHCFDETDLGIDAGK